MFINKLTFGPEVDATICLIQAKFAIILLATLF